MEIDKEEQSSTYEIQLTLNDKYYKGHFNSIENLKQILTEKQKLHNQNEDIKAKQKCIEINRTAQKQLIELENRTQEVLRNYLVNKRKYMTVFMKFYIIE
jgi:hypothetical protein